MPPRPHVALLIETSSSYARDLLFGIRAYRREHQSWSIDLAEHGRGDVIPAWLRNWRGEGIIARVENQAIADALLATDLPAVDVSFNADYLSVAFKRATAITPGAFRKQRQA